ncbi:hypothetical protein IP91_02821 [Pseudoduganella lurida]|uniref:Uncharacterized protein n=1 Tax=Pseudoduganella lurida TaxID=1036180 RepID=A0A562R946_9BURK|nr:hypothetical protein [Pseudoduganella lurida]TWI65413.1 hypothetical protein IP91_02821 [Pseudoduganella lurida]
MDMINRLSPAILGFIAFASYAVATALVPEDDLTAATFGMLVAFAAGYARLPSGPFVAGVLVSMACWVGVGLVSDNELNRAAAIITVPVFVLMTLLYGGGSFVAGKLVGLGVNALRRAQPSR